jgi:hypothetical protein
MTAPVKHRDFFIYADTSAVGDGTFTSHGFIRKPSLRLTGLPIEHSFKPHERYLSKETAYTGGVLFAKKLIDGWWHALGR